MANLDFNFSMSNHPEIIQHGDAFAIRNGLPNALLNRRYFLSNATGEDNGNAAQDTLSPAT